MNLEEVLVVGVSQSGESQDILQTVRKSGDLGASTLIVTNDQGSAMARAAQHHFFLRAGKEESVAATRTYTAELLVLYLLVCALKGDQTLGNQVRRLPVLSREVLETEWEGLERHRYADYMVVTSRGYNLATAEEAGLKLMETTYIVTQAFFAAVVVIAPPGKVRQDLRSLVESLKKRGAEMVVISDDTSVLDKASATFKVLGQCPDELSPILYAVPLQLFAENLSHLKGLNPDSPRGLSKVTETW